MLSIVEEFDGIYIVYLFLVMVILIVIVFWIYVFFENKLCRYYFYYNMIKENCGNC